ncbi:lysosomal alpha-mannosidase-like isoform X1 [Condylostylus longicornis]|uniref:lysosomal alpha-mannosidase-like isoform X1 n=1 Tax=Condylostylus longicornis TaxID=2530218 RepID=UPI00244DE184|nr:lysosomal alpha-mannosidase-like isoform X1 [Condylostylus longicornis]
MKLIIIYAFTIICVLYVVNGLPSQKKKDSIFNENEKKCGYESCPVPKPNMINVHIVPHTHDDVGWLKTVDQYYYGSKTGIQKAGVQYIIDSVIDELLSDPNKKFIYVESAFFFKWWHEQTEEHREKVKELVNQGRLEFIGGAWSMNDEATAHYQSIIDQFAWGLKRLDDTFGKCGRPRIAWQIDPFGHSREQASIFAQMGYDGLFFGRLDEADKLNRLITKNMEMVWKANKDLGESSDLFTGALYNQYQPPPGFCFDILCADEPIIDDEHSKEFNVDRRVNSYFDFVRKQAENFRTNNVILTMGGDFTYMRAGYYYKNLDKLIKYGNLKQERNNSNINLFYSTPSCYLKALHDNGTTWPTKSDDFFPYGSDPHSYWTGYFTSRPTLKRYERIGNHFLQVCKQLTVLNPIKPKNQRETDMHLSFLRETMGIMQHHDAVTGTEKQKVADDYARRINIGMNACSVIIKEFLRNLLQPADESYGGLHNLLNNDSAIDNENVTNNKNFNSISKKDDDDDDDDTKKEDPIPEDIKFEFENCLLLNISQCDISENRERFIITIYNPLAHANDEYIRVPVPTQFYSVQDYRNINIPSQIVDIPETIRALRYRKSNVQFELVFLAEQVPPMGYKSYYITRTAQGRPPTQIEPIAGSFNIKNKYLNLEFGNNGLLSRVIGNGVNISLEQDFLYYKGFIGDNRHPTNRSSGAYIFRPNGTEAIKITNKVETNLIQGHLVQEVHQKFNKYVSQVIRLYAEENNIEFEWLVGPIPIEDGIGKEIITRFNSTDIKSNGIFYTDSSGRQMIKRVRDHRETWNYTVTEPIAGNYYPILTNIALEDKKTRMAVLVDRAQGGGSIYDGTLEIMVHRRLLKDDAFGVGEPLNETAFGDGLISRGKHYLLVGRSDLNRAPTAKAEERFLQIRKHLPFWTFFDDAENISYDQFRNNYYLLYSGITLSLPKNVHLLTFEPWHENEILVRFEHIMESDDDPIYSKPVTFNIKDVFRYLNVKDIKEMTLDGNMLVSQKSRLKFKEDQPKKSSKQNIEDLIKVILKSKRETEKGKPLRNIVDVENPSKNTNVLQKENEDPFQITIKPQEILTFILTREQTV